MDWARRVRTALGVVWVAFAALVALLSAIDLAASIANASSRFNRSPGALIVIASLTAAVSLAALRAAVRALRGRPRWPGLPIGLALTASAVMLTFVYAAVSILSGPL